MDALTLGRNHPRLSEIRKAFRQGGLTPDGLLPVEGPTLIAEAIRSGLELAAVFFRFGDESDLGLDPAVPRYQVPRPVFESVTDTRESQGVIGLVRLGFADMAVVLRPDPAPLVPVLCRIQDPGNGGTIVRLAEAFGATACAGTSQTAGPTNPKFVRAAAGSLFRLPYVPGVQIERLVEDVRASGLAIVGTGIDGTLDVDQWDWTRPTVLLIGNEGSGLNATERAGCEVTVRIPHSDCVESLNAAAAAAICLYEAFRQRRSAAH